MPRSARWTLTPWLAAALLAVPAAVRAHDPDFTTDTRIEDCAFTSQDGAPRAGNPFFILDPGRELIFAGEDDGAELDLEIKVLDETEYIEFTTPFGDLVQVHARVVEERESEDGELVEVSRNFFARCRQTNDVYYFGETVDIYEDGEIVSHDGEWRAGEDGAQPGIIMPGTVLLGARYFQESAPGVALDRAENTALGLEVDVPAGSFERCVEITETSPLEPGHESVKVYCPRVGLINDGELELEEVVDPEPPEPPAGAWLTAPDLVGFRVKVQIVDGGVRPGVLETACDDDTVCVSGAVPGRVEVLVRVPGPKPNGCMWPTIAKLTTSLVEVWIEQIAGGEVRYYRLDGSSPGSSDLPGLFDRAGFCP